MKNGITSPFALNLHVIPTKVGIHKTFELKWIPVFTGMTKAIILSFKIGKLFNHGSLVTTTRILMGVESKLDQQFLILFSKTKLEAWATFDLTLPS